MKRPEYAETLEIIAGTGEGDVYQGVREFYNGSIAEQLTTFIQSNEGIVAKEDFENYFTVVEETVKTEMMGREVITCQPPCRLVVLMIPPLHLKDVIILIQRNSGPVLIEGLNIAEGLSMKDPSEPLSYHLLVEYFSRPHYTPTYNKFLT